MMSSLSTCRFVVLVLAACNSMTSAELTVNLGTAGNYAILAKAGISTVPLSPITGDIGVSPIAATAMTGFALALDSTTQFSTSTQLLTGKAHAASYGGEIAAALTVSVLNMEAAYTDAAGRTRATGARLNLGGGKLGVGGDFGGATEPLTPGVYTFDTDVLLTDDITFSGDGTYIIQITGYLEQVEGKSVHLTNGAKAENIFWQVTNDVTVGTTAHMQGIILGKTKVDFLMGSSLNGRILTQTACNLQMATITPPVTTTTPAAAPATRGLRRGLRSM